MGGTRLKPKMGQKKTDQKRPSKKVPTKPNYDIYGDGNTTRELRMTVSLVLVARRWRSLIDDHLRPISQSSARMEALSAIKNSPDPSSQIDIANRLRIEGPTMTRMIDVLSRDGLVERRPAPSDRRTKYLSITPAGESALDDTFEVADVLRTRLLKGLSDEQIDAMSDVLALLLDRLDEGLSDPEEPDE